MGRISGTVLSAKNMGLGDIQALAVRKRESEGGRGKVHGADLQPGEGAQKVKVGVWQVQQQ